MTENESSHSEVEHSSTRGWASQERINSSVVVCDEKIEKPSTLFDLNQIQFNSVNLTSGVGRDATEHGNIIAALIMENERKHAGGGDACDRRQESGGGNNNTEEEQRRSKQHAKYGQWQTPPLPAFAASGIVPPPSSTTAATTANTTTTTTTTGMNLPTNADEYARMLQEAYKKGAEAGARAQQATEQINLLGGTAATSTTTTEPSIGLPLSPVGQFNPPSMATAQIEPLIPNIPMSNIINYKTSFFPTPVPSSMGEGGGEFLLNTTAETPSSFSQSKSMPDMSSYSSQVNDEEDKRKKRLARNRASARLRRLKKKNLVDSYEGEVGILESALSKLRSHQWGSDIIDHEVLIEALSMERGQQPLTPEGRRELIQSILNQQRCVFFVSYVFKFEWRYMPHNVAKLCPLNLSPIDE